MANRTKGRNRDHDIFLKGILKLDQLVLLLLYRYLPNSLKQYIDFSTFTVLSDSYIDNKLVVQYTDSVHECALIRSKLPQHIQDMPNLPDFRFCFLWEHKSSKPYEPIEGQIERYRYAIIGSDLKNNRTPSIVIPIVLYHGETAWKKKRISEYFDPYLPPEIKQFLPTPYYIFIDINATSEEEIEKMVDLKMLRAAFLALKNAHDPKFFRKNLKKILKFVDMSTDKVLFQAFFKMLLEYAQRRSDLEADEFNELVEQNSNKEMGASVKTMFEVAEERAEQRGEQRGEQIGEQRGKQIGEQSGLIKKARIATINMLKLGTFSIEQIVGILVVDQAFVQAIQEELSKNPDLKE
ncbi:MAG: hypothetical protein HC817_01900 [Saprospiraceae bacterium]|nr:hypothetical protein [Saprospiraceae bacterium]